MRQRRATGGLVVMVCALVLLLSVIIVWRFLGESPVAAAGISTPVVLPSRTASTTVAPSASASPSVAPSGSASPTVAPSGHASPAANATPSQTPTASPTATAAVTTPAREPANLVVTPATLGLPTTASVAVLDLTDGDMVVAGGSTAFDSASIAKVDILVALLLQTNGTLSTSQKSLAAAMITESDNAAASTLFTTVGGRTGLTQLNTRLGLTSTVVGTQGNWGLTQTTVVDQLRLLRIVFTADSPLSASSRSYVASLMTQVDDDQRWGTSDVDDHPATAAVKNGWLQRSTTGLWAVNSIGRVQTGGHTYLVAALSENNTTMNGGVALVEKATRKGIAAIAAS